jgi:enoyl-CoA hydratase/carnithine racemase
VTAAEAAAWGIAHRLVGTGAAVGEAGSVARRIAQMDAGALADAKRLLADREAVARGLDAEREAFVARVVSGRATVGMDAFLRGEAR